MKLKIEAVEYCLPVQRVSNADLAQEHQEWDMKAVALRSGVYTRYIAKEDETALDLAEGACKKLFQNYPSLREKIDGIIVCTQTPDYIMPPNSCVLHRRLELSESVMAFDINLACSGYVYGLTIAQGLISAGSVKNILLVTGDTYSKLINPGDRSARVLFGDGAAVSWLGAGPNDGVGLLDTVCQTMGKKYEAFIVPAGGCRLPLSDKTKVEKVDASGNKRTQENIQMNGMDVLAFVKTRVPEQVKLILKKNNLTSDDIDLFVFHQASGVALESVARHLKIPPEKMFSNLSEIGNTVSASIPIAIRDAQERGLIGPGARVLFCGFGVGLSWGSAIVDF